MHFMFSRLDKFPENLGAISDEQGEQFHHGFMTTEVHYQDRGAIICYQTTAAALNVIVRYRCLQVDFALYQICLS